MTITVVIADDHELVRAGLRAFFRKSPDVILIGEARDGIEALRLTERLKPDVLVTDLRMPALGGLEVARQARRLSHGTRVVILSVQGDEISAANALRAGASAFVVKSGPADEVIAAIRAAAADERYIGSSLSSRTIEALIATLPYDGGDLYDTLSARERQILQMVAEGMTSAEIAEKLYISVRTVETHRANIMRKLDVHSVADLVAFVLRRGIDPDPS